jgi:hypothetical protein
LNLDAAATSYMECRCSALNRNVDEVVDCLQVTFQLFSEFRRGAPGVIETNSAKVAEAEVHDNAHGAHVVRAEPQSDGLMASARLQRRAVRHLSSALFEAGSSGGHESTIWQREGARRPSAHQQDRAQRGMSGLAGYARGAGN